MTQKFKAKNKMIALRINQIYLVKIKHNLFEFEFSNIKKRVLSL